MTHDRVCQSPGNRTSDRVTGALQRNCNCGRSTPASSILHASGEPLAERTRAFFEPRFNHDFSHVRIHRDTQAADSARDVAAHAYTVQHHVVFAQGRYAPDEPAGRQLLAHELAHVVQQGQPGGTDLSTSQREIEAQHAARSIAAHTPLPRISAASPALSRDPLPGTDDDASFQATIAEATCNIGTLCRLSLRTPAVVGRERLLRVYRACHPGVRRSSLVAGNPCLTPNFGLPVVPPAVGPRRTPGTIPATGGAPAPAAAGGLSLPSTSIQFNLGAAAVNIDLPASLSVRLPLPFRGARRVMIALNASASEFSLSITINALRHLRIIANASITTAGRGTAGLTIQTTRTTCRAVDPAAARSALETAGTRVRDAIQAVQTPPAPDPDASAVATTFAPHARLAEVVGAIANLKSEIDRVGAACREVPVASFDFGAQGQLTTPDEPAIPGTLPPANYIGGSLRLHF